MRILYSNCQIKSACVWGVLSYCFSALSQSLPPSFPGNGWEETVGECLKWATTYIEPGSSPDFFVCLASTLKLSDSRSHKVPCHDLFSTQVMGSSHYPLLKSRPMGLFPTLVYPRMTYLTNLVDFPTCWNQCCPVTQFSYCSFFLFVLFPNKICHIGIQNWSQQFS